MEANILARAFVASSARFCEREIARNLRAYAAYARRARVVFGSGTVTDFQSICFN